MTLIFGLIIMYNVTLRAINIQGLTWIEEFSRYMLVITTLIGCSIAAKSRGHLVMDSLVTAVPPRLGHSLRSIAYLLCGIMYLYLGYYSWQWTGKLIAMHRTVECNSLPLWPVWAFVTYAVATMGIRYVVETGRSIRSAIRREIMLSEQDKEIAKAFLEEEERKRLLGEGGRK
jgi:TRAP-type C4-dicarboxylate transport system permease small subunit